MAPWMFNAHAVIHSVLLLGVARGRSPRSWAMARINEPELAFALMCKSTDGNILVTFPMALMRTLVKAVWGRKVSFSSQFQRTRHCGRESLAAEAWGPGPHLAGSQEGESNGRLCSARSLLLSPFHSVQDAGQCMGCYCPHWRSSPQLTPFDNPSKACPETCCLGDSRSCHSDWQPVLTITPAAHPWGSSFPAGGCTNTPCTVRKWTSGSVCRGSYIQIWETWQTVHI